MTHKLLHEDAQLTKLRNKPLLDFYSHKIFLQYNWWQLTGEDIQKYSPDQAGRSLTSDVSSVKLVQYLNGDVSIAAQDRTRVNEFIRARELRVIDENDMQLGVISRSEALSRAQEAGLDLVEVSPNADPPVAKIIDWGKYNYQKTKARQKNKKNTKSQDLKQIRFGLKIGQHDLDVKLRKIRGFLEDGHKVKITAFFRGREMAHKEIGYQLLDRVMEQLADAAIVDQKPQMSGKYLNMVVRAGKPNAKAQNSQGDVKAD